MGQRIAGTMAGLDWEAADLARRIRGLSDRDPAQLMKVNLGCGDKLFPGWRNIDESPRRGVDQAFDFGKFPWPLDTDSADYVLLSHVLEHVPDAPAMMNELHRVTRPSGFLEVRVPHWRHAMAWGDPTHRRAFSPGAVYAFAEGSAPSWLAAKTWRVVMNRPHAPWRHGANVLHAPTHLLFEVLRLYPSEITWVLQPVKR